MNEFTELLGRRDFAVLKDKLHRVELGTLAKEWAGFKPMDKAVLFKLFEPDAAMELYRRLDPPEKYFLLCSFEPGCVAPILEEAVPAARSFFRRLPQEYFKEMSRQLS